MEEPQPYCISQKSAFWLVTETRPLGFKQIGLTFSSVSQKAQRWIGHSVIRNQVSCVLLSHHPWCMTSVLNVTLWPKIAAGAPAISVLLSGRRQGQGVQKALLLSQVLLFLGRPISQVLFTSRQQVLSVRKTGNTVFYLGTLLPPTIQLVKKGRMDIQQAINSICHPNPGIVTVTYTVRLERLAMWDRGGWNSVLGRGISTCKIP